MLSRTYSIALEACGRVARYAVVVEKQDKALASQMRRAVSSIALNVAEGGGSQGRNERARYFNAMGSARETLACLDVAKSMGYLESVDEETLDRLDHIVATLYRVTRR